MGAGWGNPTIGGTVLRIPAVQSPNFVHLVSGWAIFQDGTAEFHDIIIPPGTGGATAYFAGSAPAGANVGDLWYDTSNGLLLHQWNGTAWVPFQLGQGALGTGSVGTGQIQGGAVDTAQIANAAITSALIAAQAVGATAIANGAVTAAQINTAAGILGTQIANGTITGTNIQAATITAALIAAGTVVAGIVDGTEVLGASIVADGTNGQFLVYSGAPATGNLIGSWSGVPGTDAFGNTYPAGLSVQQGLITGLGIDGTTITNSTFVGDVLNGSTLSQPNIQGGEIVETTITFDQSGGTLLAYSSTTTTVTQTANGTYTFTVPANVSQARVQMWAAGAGGDGGNTSQGGNGAGAGEYAEEPAYPLTAGDVHTYVVGNGGTGNSTGGGHGSNGSDSFFDGPGGVYANGGNGDGTKGTGSTNTIHHDGGAGGNGAAGGGAGGGGGSAGATGAGGTASNATSTTGTAGGSAGSGGGAAGGAGGGNGANGSNASSPGAGGGGAGKGTSSGGSLTKTYSPLWYGSYLGPDATSGANTGRSNTTMYQGGETSGGGAANGNQRCAFAFNRALIASDFSGYTVTSCSITITNQHSWFNSGMTVLFDEFAGLPGAAPGSYPSADYTDTVAQGGIAEGATHTYSLGAALGQRFATGSTNGLGFGNQVAASHPYNLNYFGYFSSNVTITITGTKSVVGTTTAGNGQDGKAVITYTSGQTLIASISPVAGTDAFGNAYPKGIRGDFYNNTPPVYHADATSNLASFTATADVPGANVSVVVKGTNSTVVVIGVFDAATNASTSAVITGFLNWNGSNRSEDAVLQTGSAVTIRGTVAQTWVITGVTAGTYVAKLQASSSISGGTVRSPHTNITAMVFEGV